MSKVYFIADTHFYHTNIIKYCKRPFKNSYEMNKTIIDNWNRVVGPNDIVYHLGDISLRWDNLDEIYSKLNGTIYLLKGNHERKSSGFYRNVGFKVIPNKTKLDEYKVILSHWPLDDKDIPDGYINIHGHIHDKPLDDNLDKSKHICVAVEKINYEPIEIEKLLNKINID